MLLWGACRSSKEPAPAQTTNAAAPSAGEAVDLEAHRRALYSESATAASYAIHLDPGRPKALRIDRAISLMGLKNGMAIADIGSGPGALTFHLARAVGPNGKVYAVDIDPGAIRLLHQRMRDRKLNPFDNVIPVLNRPDDVSLGADTLDAALMVQVHIYNLPDDPITRRMLASVHRALKAGARISVVEPKKDPQFPGLTSRTIAASFEKVGFRVDKILEEEYDPSLWYLSFTKPRDRR
jgi:ubiquinone/menaquinone biosynthesis C-methylase UbiE